MKIVILDARALRENDMDFSALRAVSDDITVYPHTTNELLVERILDAEAIIINKGLINEKVLTACPSLRYIGITATGYDNIDIAACKNHGVTVTNVPGYSTESVAQQLFALLLEYYVDTMSYSRVVRDGDWLGRMSDVSRLRRMGDLSGKTLGILGFGSIGSAVARIATAFNMRVLCYTPSKKDCESVEFCTFERLLDESDILSLHCLLSPDTKGIINEKSIEKMKDGAVLCNVSRGALVDEQAVIKALDSGKLSFYLADVLTGEPDTADNPLIKHDKTIITPHVAWASENSLSRLAGEVCENLIAYTNKRPRNVVGGYRD